MRGWAAAAIACVACACGGEVPEARGTRIGFRMHELDCTIEGRLEAKLQVAGIPGFCELDVAEDRTVSGLCSGIPTGDVRQFRLVYFITIDGVEVQLAIALETIDLTGETRNTVSVEFSSGGVETNFDDDGDGATNIVEVCTGRDPSIMDR